MKVALLFDKMPFSCGMCRFSTRGIHPVCIATDRERFVNISKDGRPSWCPLQEMPKKRGKMFLTERSQNDTDLMVKSAFANCYTDGWNACLEEINK